MKRDYRVAQEYKLVAGFISLVVLGVFSSFAVADPFKAYTKPYLNQEVVQNESIDCASSVADKSSLVREYRQYSGRTIAAIRFKTMDVFDRENPKENSKLYRIFNALHINTWSAVVRDQLLFKVGDPLVVTDLEESERLLRSRSYLVDAQIEVDQACGDQVTLLVITRDVWTLEPEFSAVREGGENQHGFGISDGNIAGTGNAFRLAYHKNLNRSRIDYGFYSPHIFNTRIATALNFSETSDGQQSHISIYRPFFSSQTPWAAGGQVLDVTAVEKIRYSDRKVNEYKHQSEYRDIFWGRLISTDNIRTQRILLGYTQDHHQFEPEYTFIPSAPYFSFLGVPQNYELNYPWIEYQYQENKYDVYKNINLLHQKEDIRLGADFKVRIGYSGGAVGQSEDIVRYRVQYSNAIDVNREHLVSVSALIDGRYYSRSNDLSESLIGGKLNYHYISKARHRWYSSLSFYQGHQLLQHNELVAGGETGLRGYPLDYQRGDRRFIFTVEKRYIFDWHPFNLFRLGSVVYFDAGRAWGDRYPNAKSLADVGVGLRFNSSKAKVGSVVHIDLAFPLKDKEQIDSFQWVIKGSRSL